MLLAIDIGNTNITVGVFDGEMLKATWRLGTDVRRETDEYAALSLNILAHHGIPVSSLAAGIIASVVPPLTPAMDRVCQQYFGFKPTIVGEGTRTGIRILYETPREVGADRIAHAIAGYKLYGGPLIVVDFGTATVFDAINAEGDYLGGSSSPGVHLAADALFARASRLPRVEIARPKAAIGRNTVTSMQSGLFFGYLGLIEGMIGRFQRELGGGAKVVATGGLAHTIARESKLVDVVNEDLVLIGLRMLWEVNSKPPRGPETAKAPASLVGGEAN